MMRWILLVMAVALAGCGGKKKEAEVADMARHEYADERVEVEVMRLKEAPFHRQIATNGRLRARGKSALAFRGSGIIERIAVSNGQRVAAGAVLAELDKTEAQNSLTSAMLSFERAKIDLNDAIIGFGYESVDAPDIPERTMELARIRSGYNVAELNLENARNTLNACTLCAPFAGKVADIKGNPHERVAGDFCTLVDDSRLIVEFSVLETELEFVQKGNVVKVASFFDDNDYVDGRIVSVNPLVNANGQVLVEAEIANNGDFIDGMNVKLLVEKELPRKLVVPKKAVVMRDNQQVLFRYRGGRAQWTYVRTVMDNSDEYVVEANTERQADLQAGDTVIISGNLNLAHETAVAIKQ
jgi:RND family efflux transporter MFP subunit